MSKRNKKNVVDEWVETTTELPKLEADVSDTLPEPEPEEVLEAAEIVPPEDGVETVNMDAVKDSADLTPQELQLAGVLRAGQGLFKRADSSYRICNLLKITKSNQDGTVSLRGYGDGWRLIKKK